MNKKIISSIIASIIAITAITSVACTNVKAKDNTQVLAYSNIDLYDKSMDYINVINDYILNDKDLSETEYKSAVYMFLCNTNVPIDEYRNELHLMLLASINPSCVENFDTLFANLIKALDNENLNKQVKQEIARVYLPLAAYFHELECNDSSHIKNYNPDKDIYKCNELNAEYNRKRSR